MSHDKTMLILAIVATTCSIASMVLTASIAMKFNGKLVHKVENFLGIEIAEKHTN